MKVILRGRGKADGISGRRDGKRASTLKVGEGQHGEWCAPRERGRTHKKIFKMFRQRRVSPRKQDRVFGRRGAPTQLVHLIFPAKTF